MTPEPTSFVRGSLRLRMGGWNAAVIAVTLTALTGAAIFQERRQALRIETAHARALLDHLARMPEFQADARTAASRLALIGESLPAADGRLVLVPRAKAVPPSVGQTEGVIALRSLSLRDGDLDLQYRADPARLDRMMRRSLLTHILYGLVALAALAGGTEWILRRNLLAPLRSLSSQLDRMRDGAGWLSRVPPIDTELAELARAVADLGPGLERQVYAWIEAERRSAVALAVRNIRGRLCEPQARARAFINGLQARGTGAHHSVPDLDAVLAALDEIPRALADEEDFGSKGSVSGPAGG